MNNSLMTGIVFKKGFLRTFWDNVKRDYAFLVMMIVPIAFFVIFCYAPMYGIIIAIQDFKIGSSFFANVKWVGLRWFQEFFGSPFSSRVIINTLLLNALSIVFVFPMPIFLAILFNEVKNQRLKGFAQTASYLPYFLSVTVVVGIMTNFLSVNDGLINEVIKRSGNEAINFMQRASWFRFLYIVSEAWQTVGFSSIVYLAAIAGISPTLFEAAYVDGSSRLKNIRYITLPSIMPTIIIILILRLGSLMSVGFEKILLMYSQTTYETADVISTFVYRNGITNRRFSYATAVGFFNSVVNIAVLLTANITCRIFTETSLW